MIEIEANLEARTNLIRLMMVITENPKAINVIKRKSVGNTRSRTCQTHSLAILIHPTILTIYSREAKIRRATRKMILSNYAQG